MAFRKIQILFLEKPGKLWYNNPKCAGRPVRLEESEMARQKKDKAGEEKLGFQKNLVLYLHDLLWMLAMIMIAFLVFFRIIVVSGPSMKQTLLDGDYLLLISNLFYKEPQKGDIVVVSKQSYDDGKPIVKRVIATEGQIVDMDFQNGIVYVDGCPLEEDYTNTPTNLDEGAVFPQIVEEGCVFVMGDNRNNSKDSRSLEIGQVDKREILGKVVVLLFPGTDHGTQARDTHRIGTVE